MAKKVKQTKVTGSRKKVNATVDTTKTVKKAVPSIKPAQAKKLKAVVQKEPINHVIGRAIAKYRKAAGLSQEQLAEALGLRNEAVSRMERGIVVPTVERLMEMAEIFGCPLADLVTETSNRPTDEAIYLQSLLAAVNKEDMQMLMEVIEKLVTRLKSNN